MIIGLSGNNGAGKDTFGMLLQAALERKGKRVRRMAFADALYFVSAYLFSIPSKADCDKDPSLKSHLVYNSVTVRDILIAVGAKMREIDPDVWVKILKERAGEVEYLIITDVRFDNEAAICDLLLAVRRNGHDENVGEEYGELIINDDTLDGLLVQATKVVDSLIGIELLKENK